MTDAILLVHEDPGVLRATGAHLEELGYDVMRELNAEAGILTSDRSRPAVVVLHHKLAGGSGWPLIATFRGHDASVILLAPTGEESIRTALLAGADNVLNESAGPPLIAAATRAAAGRVRARRAAVLLMSRGMASHGLNPIGSHSPMREVVQQIRSLALTAGTTVLITGEQGVGKGYVARLLHDLGPRASEPFFQCRIAGSSAAELDSDLFGHERGAFPGAATRRQGLLEIADGGTVFLNDAALLSMELQPKVLRYLESQSFRRVGGTRDLRASTRVLAATEHDLQAATAAEQVREDLHYRLTGAVISIPPVRLRSPEDRGTLIELIHRDLCREIEGAPDVISREAMERLLEYPWPGNLREIRGVLDRSMTLNRGQPILNVEHLPGEFRARPGLGDRRHTPRTLEELERLQIERALLYNGGNRTHTARELGISRATLISKIRLYQLGDKEG